MDPAADPALDPAADPALHPALATYAAEVADRVADGLGAALVGVWLVGSGALGDFDPRRSDVDIQAVSGERLPPAALLELAERLEWGVLPNPARGLEFVLYAREDLAGPAGPRFSLNLNTGPRMAHAVSVDAGDVPGFWFPVDVSIARQHAVPLVGPPAAEVFPEPPRPAVVAAVLEALDFYAGLRGAPEQTVLTQTMLTQTMLTQTMLTACRAWAWAEDGGWRSKSDAARWAVRRLPDPRPVELALRRRDGDMTAHVGPDDVAVVLSSARAALTALRTTP